MVSYRNSNKMRDDTVYDKLTWQYVRFLLVWMFLNINLSFSSHSSLCFLVNWSLQIFLLEAPDEGYMIRKVFPCSLSNELWLRHLLSPTSASGFGQLMFLIQCYFTFTRVCSTISCCTLYPEFSHHLFSSSSQSRSWSLSISVVFPSQF